MCGNACYSVYISPVRHTQCACVRGIRNLLVQVYPISLRSYPVFHQYRFQESESMQDILQQASRNTVQGMSFFRVTFCAVPSGSPREHPFTLRI